MLVTLGACAAGSGQRVVPVRTTSIEASGTIPTDVAAILWRDSGRRPAALADIDPARMVGLDGAALEQLFGEPALIRRDAPAEIWQYRGADCVLDLFLYQDAGGQEAGRPRVLYVEARTGAAEPAPTEGCVGSVLATRRSLQTS